MAMVNIDPERLVDITFDSHANCESKGEENANIGLEG